VQGSPQPFGVGVGVALGIGVGVGSADKASGRELRDAHPRNAKNAAAESIFRMDDLNAIMSHLHVWVFGGRGTNYLEQL